MGKRKPTYYELLKHPKWQRKRLEILQRSGFQCELCGSEDDTLHVHHGYYERGRKPWEYDDETLHAYCEQCHQEAENVLLKLRRLMGEMDPERLGQVIGFIKARQLLDADRDLDPSVLIVNYAEADGAGQVLGVSANDVIRSLNNAELTQDVAVALVSSAPSHINKRLVSKMFGLVGATVEA